jgi:hypothetical protein
MSKELDKDLFILPNLQHNMGLLSQWYAKSSSLISSVVLRLLHSFRVGFPTRFECSFTSSPLVSSGVLRLPTRFECSFTSSPLVSSIVLRLLHSFRVLFYVFSTRFECSFSRNFSSVLAGLSAGIFRIEGVLVGLSFYLFIQLLASTLVKLTVVLDYYVAMETYSRIGLLRSY